MLHSVSAKMFIKLALVVNFKMKHSQKNWTGSIKLIIVILVQCRLSEIVQTIFKCGDTPNTIFSDKDLNNLIYGTFLCCQHIRKLQTFKSEQTILGGVACMNI